MMKYTSRMNHQIPGNLYLQMWKLAWTIMLAGIVGFVSTGSSKADTIH
jgi:hypothetical protein